MTRGMVVLILSMVTLVGCSAAPAPVTQGPNPLDIDTSEYPRMFRAAEQILRENGFDIDRRDYRYGVVTAKPLTSPTLFEPWKHINTTVHQSAVATFNDERRLVRVEISPAPKEKPLIQPSPGAPLPMLEVDPGYLIRVEVMVEHLQVPVRRLNGSTSGYRIFNTLGTVPTEMRERGITAAYWEPLGRDTLLEQRLLNAIVRRSLQIR